MIEHLVLIKFKAGTTESNVAEMLHQIRLLQNKISEIKEISAGTNITDRAKGFNVGVRVLLGKREDIEVYRTHPAHVAVLNNYIMPHLEDIMVIDYEF